MKINTMKKLHRIVSVVVFGMISFAFISCSHQEMEGTDVGVLAENQFYASFYDNSSKVVMDSGYNLSWEKGDLVSVFDEDGNNMLFTADESAQNTALTGSVDIDETASYYAAFPYAETKTLYKNVDLTSLGLEHEPEAVYFHKGDMYITFFQEGKTAIYKISPEVYE